MEKIICALRKYKCFLMYGIFGVLTTIVNVVIYYVCYIVLTVPNVFSTVVAWIVAVGFAFITNKIWVFESTSFEVKIFSYEIVTFFGSRIVTGIIDLLFMIVSVDYLGWNSSICKLISNGIVIVENYVASRLLIFRKGLKQD